MCSLLFFSQIQYQSDTVQVCGSVKESTRLGLSSQKTNGPEYKSHEREYRGDGNSVSTGDVRESTLCTYDVVCSPKTDLHV